MAQSSGLKRIAGPLAEQSGATEDEMLFALTVAAIVGGVFGFFRLVRYFTDLGGDVHSYTRDG